VDDGRDLTGGGRVVEEFPACDQYGIQADVFSRAIREGGEAPLSIEDAIQNMAVIEAVLRSAESGRWEKP
jgi:predicted dehydrogenase